MPIVGSVPGFLARMRTFDQRARELLNEVGLFNKFALPSVAPGPTNNNCDHQLLLSQYQGASCLVNVSMLWVLSTLEKYSSPSRKNISYAVQQKLSTGIIIHISNPLPIQYICSFVDKHDSHSSSDWTFSASNFVCQSDFSRRSVKPFAFWGL